MRNYKCGPLRMGQRLKELRRNAKNGKVVGNCEISFFKGMKTKHRAGIGIALISDFWNQGIGTKMFEEMIRLAESGSSVSKISHKSPLYCRGEIPYSCLKAR